jgi:hypothetical protein
VLFVPGMGRIAKHRRAICATNMLEQLFGEERRRAKVIPHSFGELKLRSAALIRAAERWRGLRITEFERANWPRSAGSSLALTSIVSENVSPHPRLVYPARVGLAPSLSSSTDFDIGSTSEGKFFPTCRSGAHKIMIQDRRLSSH